MPFAVISSVASTGLPLNSGLSGHLHLVCRLDSRGQSVIGEQSFRAPMHISKPYTDESTLVVNIVNPTAGLLAGDRIESDIAVESGARLLLSTPSASRAHRMPQGQASVIQRFSVSAQGSLENWPELFIPQSGARYRQTTNIAVANGGELMFWELLAPGRVASGESFQFVELDWNTAVRFDDRLVLRERYRIAPADASVGVWKQVFATGYYASGILFSPRFTSKATLWQDLHSLHTDDIWIGVSSLVEAGWAVRLLAKDSVTLRRTLREIRSLCYRELGRPMPSLRRTG